MLIIKASRFTKMEMKIKKKKENERRREVRNTLSTLNRKAVTTVLEQSNKETFPQKNREALTSIEHQFSRTFFYTKFHKSSYQRKTKQKQKKNRHTSQILIWNHSTTHSVLLTVQTR